MSHGPATWALLLLKWWARLHFVSTSAEDVDSGGDTSPSGAKFLLQGGANHNHMQDFFTNQP